MTVAHSPETLNPNPLLESFDRLREFVADAARDGLSLKVTEETVLKLILQLAHAAMTLFFTLQGSGDLGPTLETDDGTLHRSDEPHTREVRTLFGEHSYAAYIYGRDLDRKIDFRPVDVRMELPAGKFSPKFCEIAHLLFAEQAFERTAKTLEAIFGHAISVHSLERISETLAPDAEQFLFQVPIPKTKDEGQLLVMSGDGKGVPMIREEVAQTPAFEKKAYPGNRKMATLATVYSVDCFYRTADEVLDALFRETKEKSPSKRPEPVGKVVVGFLTQWLEGDEEPMLGSIQAFTWAQEQMTRRHRPGQPLIRLMDGQASLWDMGDVCAVEGVTPIDILDIIHVSSYVWTAAKIFHAHREHQEAFTRDRLGRILRGDVGGVISGLRQMATKQKLSKADVAAIEVVCGYFEKNRDRMKYDEYLRSGYPIATGVIEGACRHLVMDRLCRTGMRWSVAGSQAMLHMRAVHQADLGKAFHNYRADCHREKLSEYRSLLKDYEPHTLCG